MTHASIPNVGLLSSVTRGRMVVPPRILLYGCEGVGKSTLAADAPSPVFVGAEDGTKHLEVPRFAPTRWEHIIKFIDELARDKHDYQTVVLDTADWAEPFCWDHVCSKSRKTNIEDFGFGKGYTAALDEWRRLLNGLDHVRTARKMNVIVLAHSKIVRFNNPEGEDFDRYTLKLNDKASAKLKEWADVVLFANFETVAHTKNGRTRGIDTGARVMHTVRSAAFDAKNRYGLPVILPLSWHELEKGIQVRNPAAARARLEALIPRLTDEMRAEVEAALERAGEDAAKFAQLTNWVQAKIQIQNTAEAL